MRTETHAKGAARRKLSARTHRDAHPNGKAAAIDNGVTYRTERRWRTPAECQGAPQEKYDRYLETAQWPDRLLAHSRATVMEKRYRSLSRPEVVRKIRELYTRDAETEGEENAARFRRGISPLDRASLHERDAAHDIALSALWRRAHDLGISEAEVFGLPSEEFGR